MPYKAPFFAIEFFKISPLIVSTRLENRAIKELIFLRAPLEFEFSRSS